MPFSGAGVYTPPAADFPVVTQTVISSTHFNNTINDIATALSTCLTKDGQQTATANIPFGGFRATNVGITAIAGSVGTPAINVSDAATGLYRSAASELAVTVAGTQRARFDGTGLIVTGVGTFSGATSTTTLTASTSVVTGLGSAGNPSYTFAGSTNAGLFALSATDIRLALSGTTRYFFQNGNFIPGVDNDGSTLGLASFRWSNVFTPIIDSGTTGSLSLKLNNGEIGFQVVRNGIAVNNFTVEGSAAGGSLAQRAVGTDTDISVLHTAKGAGIFQFNTGGGAQFQVLHTAAASRNITVTGSNGGNPTLGVTGGSLAITPSVIVAGTLTVGANPATTNALGIPYATGLFSRNSANSNDISLIQLATVNAVVDIVKVGIVNAVSAGVVLRARSGGAAPTTSDLLASEFTVWRDTGGATTKLYYNNAGAIQSVALA